MLRASANGFGMRRAVRHCWPSSAACTPVAQRSLPQPHFAPRAKNVIFCFMDGGVSHVDSFDPKPKLAELDGKPFTESTIPRPTAIASGCKSPWAFQQHGQSGMPVSELFPHIATCADDLAVIRSMKADLPLHSTGVLFLHTGSNNAGRPSLGSWVNYGLGSENRNLPGFVVLSFGVVPCGGLENFSSGFLPASHQATLFAADGTPIDNIAPGRQGPRESSGPSSTCFAQQDGDFARSLGGDDAVEAAIRNYEMAYRMQSLVPDVLDLAARPRRRKKLYGIDSTVPTAAALRHPVPAGPAAGRGGRALRRDHLPARRLATAPGTSTAT